MKQSSWLPNGQPRPELQIELLIPKEMHDRKWNGLSYTGNHSGVMVHYFNGKEVRRTTKEQSQHKEK